MLNQVPGIIFHWIEWRKFQLHYCVVLLPSANSPQEQITLFLPFNCHSNRKLTFFSHLEFSLSYFEFKVDMLTMM